MKGLALIVAYLLLIGCTAGQIKMQPGSENIHIGFNPPDSSYYIIGPISATHGGGCGLYGAEGNFEGAMNILRNKAAERNADYIQIIRQQGEHMSGLCLDRAYDIDGMAYRKKLKTTDIGDRKPSI